MTNFDDEKVVYFGETDARNKRVRFGIKKKDRSRHLYAIGKTGMGKSTLLENLAVQDIQNGDGVCFIDPHGKSADLLLEYVPEHRIKDVIYFAPFDMEYPISFNVMEDVGPEQRYLVASGMMSAFKKIWVDAWSARMEYILGNIMLALLEYPGSTLVGVNRMLTDKDFRKEVVNHISDPSVKSFWVNEYANYTDKFAAEAAPAIQNKVGQFVANPLIRNIIGQPKSSFDIREIMDNKKILIINLSKGRVGEANANLLGSMLITKIYLGAMSRADLNEKQLAEAPNFYLYVDEFQSFANESFADILSEARKYKLNLHIAHQYIEQMTEEVRAAVFGNVGTMCIYRVGAYDAEVLEKEFAPQFTAEDIVNLQKYQMYLKLMIDGVTSPPFSAAGMPPIKKPEISYVKEIIDSSRALYARPRAQIEEELLNWIQTQFGKGGQSGGGQGGAHGERAGSPRGDFGDRQPRGNSSSSFSSGGHSNNDSRSKSSHPAMHSSSKAPVHSQLNTSVSSPAQTNTSSHTVPRTDRDRGDRNGGDKGERSGERTSLSKGDFGDRQLRGNYSERPRDSQGIREHRDGKERRENAERASVRENRLREAMSLSYLKPEVDEDKKTPKPENLAALREALLSVMKTNSAEIQAPNQAHIQVHEPTKIPTVTPGGELTSTPVAHTSTSHTQNHHSGSRVENRTDTHATQSTTHSSHHQKESHEQDKHEPRVHEQVKHEQRRHEPVRHSSERHEAPKSRAEVAEDVLKNIFTDEE